MAAAEAHYRTITHYHEPGDFHELTFSCYHRLPLLTNDTWRCLLAESLHRALVRYDFALAAFVFMPEHVHLLVYPRQSGTESPRMEALLWAIKRPYSYRIKELLVERRSPLLARLTVTVARRGEMFRCWQKGPGYDRNLHSEKAVLASLDYIHQNPVRRGLCAEAVDWRWSSACWYAWDGSRIDPDLPALDGIPADFF